MTMAISKAVEDGREGGDLRLDRQHQRARAAATPHAPACSAPCWCRDGKIALGKLAQALVHGAKLLQVDGNFDDCLALARELARGLPGHAGELGEPRPDRGPEDRAFEIVDALGDAPDVHCLPVGNAGNITAYWKGYVEYAARRPDDEATA